MLQDRSVKNGPVRNSDGPVRECASYIGVVKIDVVMRVHVLGQLSSSCSYCIYTDPIIMVLGNGISKFHLCLIVRSYTFPIFY